MKNRAINQAQEIPTPSDESLQEIYDLVYSPIRVKPNHVADDLIGTQLSRFTSLEEARLEINALSEFPDEEDDFWEEEEDDNEWEDDDSDSDGEEEDEEGYW
jgi:hypothetical protein